MLFPCVAAVAAAATHSPAWFLSGAYHPPLPGKSNREGFNHITGGSETGTEISGEALTVALDVVQAWAVLLTLGFTLIIFFFLAFCVCSKKDDGYDEFEVSQGITTVKICHDGGENGVSFIPRINGSGTESMKATDETSEASSRYTLKRELPAIPTSVAVKDIDGHDKSERPISQHSSDLYASVNESVQGSSNFKLIGGVQVLPAGAIAPGGRAAVVKECVSPPKGDQVDGSIGKQDKSVGEQVCPPYAQVKKSHPYAQVSKTEHPYAKVTAHKGVDLQTDNNSYDEIKNIPKDPRKREESRFQSASQISQTRKDEKHLPLASHLLDSDSKMEAVGGAAAVAAVSSPHSSSNITTSSHSTVSSHSIPGRSPTSPQYRSPTSPSQMETSAPIPAAMAISGRTPANEEMPYMTPPVLQPTREQSQHFSGDSQDSRGYTSISVREPLAALKARQGTEGAISALGRTSASKGVQSQGSEGEGYYMTVSDDSADEMYACIYEGSRGTGSETYAQIEPRTTPSSQAPPSVLSASSLPPSSPTGLSSRTPQDPSPPAPPSVDSLRHVVHSRQASASSSASTGMGSPVAEKRGTRSPLPPLPQGDASLYSPSESSVYTNQPVPKSPPKSVSHITDKPTPRSLEEMYAKVLKKPHGHSRGSSSGAVESSDNSGNVTSRRGSADIGRGLWTSTSPTSAKPPQDMSHSMVENRSHDAVSGVNRAKSCDVSASWGGISSEERKKKSGNVGGNYETIPPLYSGSDPGYETVKNGEPPYASVDPSENYPGYETVRGSDVESEPGYETLKQKEYEPGYETVSEIMSKKSLSSEPGYESVTTTEYEPGYETVSSKKSSDPGYESVRDKEKVEYDPGYEELSHPRFGRTSSETDPNYEQLKFTSRRSSGEGDNGYEVVKKVSGEGNYELVSDYDTQTQKANKDDEPVKEMVVEATDIPLYASVNKKDKVLPELPESKVEKINENYNLIAIEATLIDLSKEDKSESSVDVKEEEEAKVLNEDENIHIVEQQDTDQQNPCTDSVSEEAIPASKDLKLDDHVVEETTKTERFQVMDSPEEVELPPPGGEDDNMISPPLTFEESQSNHDVAIKQEAEQLALLLSESDVFSKYQQTAAVSLTFTEASPQEGSPETGSTKSSGSRDGSPKEETTTTVEPSETKDQEAAPAATNDEPLIDMDIPSAPPPQFSNSKPDAQEEISSLINNVDEPLPPPPLPSLEDDIATASPPPPPPPIPDEVCGLQHELPPPPLDKEPITEVEINGLSPSSPSDQNSSTQIDSFPICSPPMIHDLPPPLISHEEKLESETEKDGPPSKNGCVNGGMTVTVNPMADIEEDGEPPLIPLPQVSPLIEPSTQPTTPPTAPSAESGESQSSGSTVNGSGSVESVVTVDTKKGGEPSTTVPPQDVALPPLQHSSSTSSSDSKHSDPNEGITPV